MRNTEHGVNVPRNVRQGVVKMYKGKLRVRYYAYSSVWHRNRMIDRWKKEVADINKGNFSIVISPNLVTS